MDGQSTPEFHLGEMLAYLEKEDYSSLVSKSWEVLYSTIIPFERLEIFQMVPQYIKVVRQLLSVPAVFSEAERILSVVDLIVHPRKASIIEERAEKNKTGEEEAEAKEKHREKAEENQISGTKEIEQGDERKNAREKQPEESSEPQQKRKKLEIVE